MSVSFSALVALLLLCAVPALADDDQDTASPDKSSYTLFNPVPYDELRAFSPDRPTKSSGATTVDAGHFQYEADFAVWTYDRYSTSSTTSSSFVFGDPTLKMGLTENTDIELAIAPANTNYVKDRTAGTHASSFGFGDLYTKVKFNLVGNEGGTYALAVVPYVKAPTASPGIGNRHWEGGAYAPLSISLPSDFGLNFQSEVDLLERADFSGIYSNYQNLVNISHPLFVESVTGFVEFWSDVSTDQNAPVQYTGDLSVAWLVKDNLQLDAGINIGLNRAAPDVQSYMGISQRF